MIRAYCSYLLVFLFHFVVLHSIIYPEFMHIYVCIMLSAKCNLNALFGLI